MFSFVLLPFFLCFLCCLLFLVCFCCFCFVCCFFVFVFCCCVGLLVVEKLFVNQMISMIMHFTLHCSTLAGWAYWLNSFMNNKWLLISAKLRPVLCLPRSLGSVGAWPSTKSPQELEVFTHKNINCWRTSMESDFPISRFPDFPYRESWTQSSFILDPRPTTLVQSFSSRHDASHTSVVLVSV